jgi:hypothetical protein
MTGTPPVPTSTKSIANAVMIQGATGSSYTVLNTTVSQTGTVYYVVVSNGSTSSVDSNTAFTSTEAHRTSTPGCSSGEHLVGVAALIRTAFTRIFTHDNAAVTMRKCNGSIKNIDGLYGTSHDSPTIMG